MPGIFSKLPHGVAVFLILLVGLILIRILNPPHDICDAQMEAFRDSQIGFLYLDPKRSHVKTPGVQSAEEKCKTANSLGGCSEFFEGIDALISRLEATRLQCRNQIFRLTPVSKTLVDFVKLYGLLPWLFSDPLSEFRERQGWYRTPQIDIFCRLRQFYIQVKGRPEWDRLVRESVDVLPTPEPWTLLEKWPKSVYSISCS